MERVNNIILLLGIAGLAFAGYLSSYKLLNNACALNESCPYFLGYPACYFGFVMYFAITVFAVLLVFKKIRQQLALNAILTVSFLGILFAGYYTVGELPLLFEKGFNAYVLGLPTCALGLIFYIAIFSLTLYAKLHKS
ncbi:MAG: hypothetical protein COU25_02535 [Candidatus Levybacteria bacterium CG10_big_fil_rev_8_21_14_0_10_35_13]|nr:MAG: hypothetical protein COU25_02535 [Candidatus Levybacteria bacterium CG10_big_fil_rev_8_21_14_0_10_35_13]